MKSSLINQFDIDDGFWNPRLKINADVAIYHQWEQLEKTACIENFRLVADRKAGFREGYFFADSDAYKWLDAAARIYAHSSCNRLKALIDDFIALIGRTQTEDGYIYTYNQFHFPGVRWKNLQIEHELYCHGHLIEAGVSHFEATGERSLLEIAVKAADLLVADFAGTGPENTPGHEEVEIALLRLYQITEDQRYLDLAEQFIEQRGRINGFFRHILRQNQSVEARGQTVQQAHDDYLALHPEHELDFQLPPDNASIKPPFGNVRWLLNTGSGKYFQQHMPVRQQTVPVGHAVRFTYLETALAMLYQHRPEARLRSVLEQAWERMVSRRMYVTGGIGSLPNIEGFGRDYELNPEYSYSETCAALGSMLWNWEMTAITGQAQYADLFEWQLYNAAAVGLGQDGTSYLYNNPLSCHGGLTRAAWFKCPCCPSNVSRVWANLGEYICTFERDQLWVHQYIGGEVHGDNGVGFRMESGLPWDGKVRLNLALDRPSDFVIHFRVPGWVSGLGLLVNGQPQDFTLPQKFSYTATASGYDPRESWYLPVKRTWKPGDVVDLDFEMAINIRAAHHKVKSTLGQVSVTYGPLVYCLEGLDNPDVDIFAAQLDPASLYTQAEVGLFDGITVIQGQTITGRRLTFIPYYLWANRGETKMTVYMRI